MKSVHQKGIWFKFWIFHKIKIGAFNAPIVSTRRKGFHKFISREAIEYSLYFKSQAFYIAYYFK